MKKIINRALLICLSVLSIVAISNAQKTVVFYWDFNKAYPIGGAGGDSLGTPYSYTHSTRDTLYAPYESYGKDRAKIVYSRPPGVQTTPLLATKRDSILDDGGGSPYCYINDLHILGNDTSSNQANNDYVRSRNPDENAYMYLYMPTTGYKNMILNYAISASSTKGAYYNIFSYSTNGGTTWNNLTTAMDTFNIHSVYRPDTLEVINPTTAGSNWYAVSINFTSDPNVNNNPNFILRWKFEGSGSNGTSGNDRYDNISFIGDSNCEHFTMNPVNVTACPGGNVQFTASVGGGNPPYTYQWQLNTGSGWNNISNSPPYSGVTTNTLTVTGVNSNMSGYQYRCTVYSVCTGNYVPSSAATLNVDPPLYDSLVGLNVGDSIITFCTPTSATVGSNGGTSPYTYLWSPGGQTTATVTGLSTGTYTITVTDALGCSASTSLFVVGSSIPFVIISSISHTNVECTANGTATVNAAQGVPPYTYLWSNAQTNSTATGLSVGTYTISVTDQTGCSATGTATIINTAVIRDSITGLGPFQVIHYWDFNQTPPGGGGGGDSLGNSHYPLVAPYSLIPGGNPRIIYTRPNAHQTTPLVCTLKDSIIDNGTQGAFVNDLNKVPAINFVLGNDTASNVANNLFIRSRNPDENAYIYMYLPTNGYKNIQLNYAISASSTKGALFNVFSYSTNGGSTWNPLTSAMDTFNTGGNNHPDSLQMINPTTAAGLWYPVQINFSSDNNVNNNPNFILRWEYEGTGSNGTSGNDRYDNFSVSGSLYGEQCNASNDYAAQAGVKYGTGPYTYSWAPAGGTNALASNLSAGVYTLTVTDANGCSATSTISITQPSLLSASISSSTNILCNGGSNGSASVTASGGTSPYGYRWSPGNNTTTTVTGLSAGTYTITVTDLDGCIATASVTLTQPNALLANATLVNNINCNGSNTGAAQSTPSGGTPAYTFAWSNGATTSSISSLSAGTYTLTVTDAHGCNATGSVTITQPSAALLANVTLVNNISCNGNNNGSTQSAPSGGTPTYIYSWSNGATTSSISGLSAGAYTLTVTDAYGCTATGSVTITQPSALLANATITSNVNCNNNNSGSIQSAPSGGTPAYTYTWSNGATTSSISSLSAGSYTVTVTDHNGCTATAAATITQAVALRDSIVSVVGPQVVVHYWDFNNTLPNSGNGGDSLGTPTYPLPAQYTLVSPGNPRIVYTRPNAHQTTPLVCTLKDSILDNGASGAFVNDLHILGNDTASSSSGNLYVRSRNPDENSYFYLYLPTTGYSNIQMNYAISASSTKGAFYNVFGYSTNGGITWNRLTAPMDTFNSGGHPHPRQPAGY
jgi:hypothetical protein